MNAKNGEERAADYSTASAEEREQVIAILERNLKAMLKMPQVKDRERLRQIVSDFQMRIRRGERFTGKEFERLVKLFRKRPL